MIRSRAQLCTYWHPLWQKYPNSGWWLFMRLKKALK